MNLWHAVEDKAAQMQDSQRQAVRSALKAGAQLLGLFRYSPTGGLVLRVSTPDTWHGETYDRFRHLGLSCIVPEDKEAATIAWVQRKIAGGAA